MSRYLMRLVMRGREISEAQSMQPFVRTTSPVAEHDQRIGMMGFEGFEPGEASLAEAGLETGAEQGDMLQPLVPPSITTAGETGVTTAQRKIASSPAGTAGSTVRGEAAAAEVQMQSHIQPSEPRAVRSDAPVPPVARNVTNRAKRLASPSSSVGAPDLADADDVSLLPSAPLMVYPAKDVVADGEGSVSSTGGIHPEALSLGDSQTDSASRPFGPGVVHTRPIRQTRQVDSTHLEPSPGDLAGHLKPPLERTSEPSADAHEGPRIVIGRINVEVVPPPAAPPSTAAPRPGPLTAAAASVIGPLGGGIRPSLRLSLRHR
jgi:hypothetical protein